MVISLFRRTLYPPILFWVRNLLHPRRPPVAGDRRAGKAGINPGKSTGRLDGDKPEMGYLRRAGNRKGSICAVGSREKGHLFR